MIDPETYANLIADDCHMHFAATRDDKQLLSYAGGIYIPYGDTAIHESIMQITQGAGVTTHAMKEIVNLTRWRNYVDRSEFDADSDVINMDNGLYSMETGLMPHTHKHLSLHKSPIKYDPDATCPNIDKFIEGVVPEAYRQTIYEIGGYALSPSKNLKRAFIFVGEKNSGKSVMIALLEHLIGVKATTHVSPLTVSNTTYGAAQYYGKQLNVVDDLGNTPIVDTGVLKSVIAGGSIEAQFKYAQPFDYKPNILCVFATNEVPTVEPFDEAYASRFSMIDFPNSFEGETADPDLISKLTTPEELSGFFNKCMAALVGVNEQSGFTNDTTLADNIKAYKYQAHPVEQFVDEMCSLDDPDAFVMKDTLFRSYTSWSEDHHCRTEDMKYLTMSLQRQGCVIKQITSDEGDRKRAYIGVDFKTRISDFA